MSFAIEGVFCAAATPMKDDGTPDLALFGAHAKALIDEGCHGIAMLGSTGEANSFSVAERKALLEAAIAGGARPDQLLPGTSSCAITDAVDLTRHAVGLGVHRVVLLPPFYYTAFSDESLFRFYARIIEGVGDDRLRVLLYHIPMLTGVPISHGLIEMLVREFPGIVAGIKDSDGKLDNMHAVAARFPGFAVLAGADPLLLPLLEGGGAGCVTASSNLVARELRFIFDHWREPARGRGQGGAGHHRCLARADQQLHPAADGEGDAGQVPRRHGVAERAAAVLVPVARRMRGGLGANGRARRGAA